MRLFYYKCFLCRFVALDFNVACLESLRLWEYVKIEIIPIVDFRNWCYAYSLSLGGGVSLSEWQGHT